MINAEAPPFIDPKQTISDLLNAVEYLDTHGWTQGMDRDEQGRCCMFGALRGVTGDDRIASRTMFTQERCSNAARAFYRVMQMEMTTYNDIPGQTAFEAKRALETVANALKEDPRRA